MVTSSSGYGFRQQDRGWTGRPRDRSPTRCSSSSSPTTRRCRTCSRARRSAGSTSSSTARRRSPTAFIASGNYFRVLGVTARLGRTILPEDDTPTAPPVAVISSKYWHSRFGSDPAVVGKIVKINNVPVTIVGVIPPQFTGVQQPLGRAAPDISVPLALDTQLSTGPGKEPPRLSQADRTGGCRSWARLKPGVDRGPGAGQPRGGLPADGAERARCAT